ncbi:MAG: hypothetical protein QOC81_4659 [Thermoanaerobaculia bacterium]|jgi:hypothetical protein|nr:hypothetical protein [Thermoanaerobaculia bacterium]
MPRRIAIAIALIVACLTLNAGTHRATAPPKSPIDETTDALGIGPMSGSAIRGTVASVQGTQITLNTGGAPAITIEASAAKFMNDHSGAGSLADIKPGTRITAFINTAPTLQPSSALRAQLITIESQPDLELTGSIDSIDVPHSRFVVLGITITADASTTFGSTFPTFAAIKSVGDLAVGQVVNVTARFASGIILATNVQVTLPTIQPPAILSGTVKSIGPASWVISREGKETTVSIDAQTKIIGDPKVGDSVQVMAIIDSSHSYLAIAIVKLGLPEVTSELHGTVKSITASQWVLGGPLGSLAPDFNVKITSTTVIYPDPKVGDRVVVTGTRDTSGTFTATKISKEK